MPHVLVKRFLSPEQHFLLETFLASLQCERKNIEIEKCKYCLFWHVHIHYAFSSAFIARTHH